MDKNKINLFKKEHKAIITIQELLQGLDSDFDNAKTIRIVRHADNRKKKIIEGKELEGSLYYLYRYEKPTFLKYQKEQQRQKFINVDYIVSFIGERGTTARFVGVYKVGNKIDSPYNPGDIICDMDIMEAFEPLTHRVVIEWGKNTNCWCQDYKTQLKSVIRIDEGFEDADGIPRFISYDKTILTLNELKSVINSPEDNPWHTALKSLNCIYLITDRKTGKQYVGSTYNTDGIFGRWQCYSKTNGHGDNKRLKELLAKEGEDYMELNCHWTILEILPMGIEPEQATEREKLYKTKLMTYHPMGYNDN